MRLRFVLPLMFFLLFFSDALAISLPGYAGTDARYHDDGYSYVTFGVYPYDEEGNPAPVLWRILGPGTPEELDVIDAENVPERKWKKTPNGDDLTGENADVVCLMTESIIDFVLYHGEKDVLGSEGLNYEDTVMYAFLNTECIDQLFTPDEQDVLVYMPDRGYLGLPTRKGELFRRDYGFVEEDFTTWQTRRAKGTPYAISKGLKILHGYSWYFTADWRKYGFRWIVGDNGHISVAGVNREGGIRPVCYVHSDLLQCTGGQGTREDPWILSPIK